MSERAIEAAGLIEQMREALRPFAAFCEKAEAFVDARAKDSGSPILPSTDFRLSDFRKARAALAAAQRVAGEDDRLREAAKTAINCLRWLDRAGGLGIDRHDNIRQVADRLEAALALSRGKVWRCFNCDQVFTDAAEASAHFGNFKGDVPTCRMSNYDVCALRMSRDAFAKRAEDSDRDADALKAENFRLTTERNEARFAVQFLIDHIEYNDSYGVEGSSFMCCHLCSGGGAPGVTLKHDPSCAVARYEQVAQEWEEERKSEFADAQAAGVSPGKVEGWREINVNDNVRVKLTARGRELHRRNHEQLVASLPASAKLQYYAPKEDADGWSEWQLWCLMQEFGPHILMGCEPPFETTIKLPSPPISSRAE